MKYVWRIFPYLCVDYKAAQAWLERQGAEGLRLAGVSCRYLARFTREARPVHYFVDLAADGGADYLQLCADAGWERVAQVQGMDLFVSRPGEDPVPIQSDPIMEERRFGRKFVRSNLLGILGALAFLALVVAVMAAMTADGVGFDWAERLFLVNSNLLVPPILLCGLTVVVWETATILLYWRRSRRTVAAGQAMPAPSPFWSRFRGDVNLAGAVLSALFFLALILELFGLLAGQQRQLDLDQAGREAYRACPVVMAEDLGLPEGEQRRLREIHSLLVPEYADYFELTHTGEGESCFVDSIRYRCRWEWTAELLYRLLRWECEAEGVSALHRGGTALLDAELGFDAACATADGSYVLLRQGDVVALVGCDGMDMTAPERLEMLWGRLDLKEETT